MANLETSLKPFLATIMPGTNFYPLRVPQVKGVPVLPCATYSVVSEVPVNKINGSAGLTRTRIQFSFFSKTFADVANGAESLRLVLHGYSGTIGDVTATKVVKVNGITPPAPPPNDASDTTVFHKAVDYMFTYYEQIPSL